MAVTKIDEASSHQDMVDILTTFLTDITAIAAKLDADAGVTDTDYEAGLTVTVT